MCVLSASLTCECCKSEKVHFSLYAHRRLDDDDDVADSIERVSERESVDVCDELEGRISFSALTVLLTLLLDILSPPAAGAE